jgi:hypothetical protein|tara:strand:+ start:1221 stop:1397 length:177 start_codon:yes stop_codon:yes gene_type:complete
MIGSMVISMLKEKKQSICDELNDMINIPLVSEKKEQACIESVFDAFMDVLEKVLTKEK